MRNKYNLSVNLYTNCLAIKKTTNIISSLIAVKGVSKRLVIHKPSAINKSHSLCYRVRDHADIFCQCYIYLLCMAMKFAAIITLIQNQTNG